MGKKSDDYYIDEILNGDPGSYSYIVDKYKDMAFSLALKITGNREDAEDSAQEAFVKAYKSLSLFRRDSSFKTWLFRIVYNTSISRIRSKKKDKPILPDTELNEIQVSETEEALKNLKRDDRQQYLTKALSKLEEEESSLLNMFYYESFTTNEISHITGLSESNVKVKLHRSRKKLYMILRSMLKDEIISIL